MTRLLSSIWAIITSRDFWRGHAQGFALFPAPSRPVGYSHGSEAEAFARGWKAVEGDMMRATEKCHAAEHMPAQQLPTRYRLLKDAITHAEAVAGTIVYRWDYYDYGLAAEDTEKTGVPHISVTLNSHEDYPFFTVPERDLEVLS